MQIWAINASIVPSCTPRRWQMVLREVDGDEFIIGRLVFKYVQNRFAVVEYAG